MRDRYGRVRLVAPPRSPDATPPQGRPAGAHPEPPAALAKRPRRTRTVTLTLAAAVVAGAATSGAITLVAPDGEPGAGTIAAPAPDPQGGAPTNATEAAAQRILPSVVQVRAGRGTGSGVAIDGVGHVVTNAHVVQGSDSVSLVLSDGSTTSGRVIGSDERNDIAVIATNPNAVRAATIGQSGNLRIGQPVIAVGSPLGLNGTVTSGIVSSPHRSSGSRPEMIQTDAAINPGNSGGPLVDLQGRVVGINTSIATLGGPSGNIGIGFAVPIDRVRTVAQALISQG
ncbi:trypsin-like peptidase domain-containing protein [Nocardioides sp. NBC_00850]|uniref:S1C family serine protease n=1 Tax=Nocardioides sp. NBC_00850 TaxID=2976001 RepID=UPI003868770E|nr:trypsin-like peptidase domain-containing protein [Nocardioides sp. NBC_00850]